jgi:hypothetical protein
MEKAYEHIFTLDTPLAKVYQQIHTEAHASGNAAEYLVNWRKSNPELAEQMREYMSQISKEVHGAL